MTTTLERVYSEEKARGFSPMAPKRLVWAALTDAEHGIRRERVEALAEFITYLDSAMATHPNAAGEQISRARAINPRLLDVLDKVQGDHPDTAWAAYMELDLMADIDRLLEDPI